MTTYYVATTGDDEDGGGAGDPWATPEHAINAVSAGDTVYYANGTYDLPNDGLTTWSDGSSGSQIFHIATNRRQVTWRAVATPLDNRLLDMTNVDYVTLDGILIDAGTSLGLDDSYASRPVYMYNTTNVTLDDVEITGGKHGIDIEGACENITVIRCENHPEYYKTGEFGNAFLVNGANNLNILLQDTQVYHSDHTGVDINEGVDGLTIIGCTVRDNHSHNFSIGIEDGTNLIENGLIAENVIYGAENWGPNEPGDIHSGIWIKDAAENITIRNNRIYENDGPGIMLSDRQNDYIYVYNNTLYSNCLAAEAAGQGEIYLSGPDETTPTIVIKNNLLYATETGRATLYSNIYEDNITIDHNCHFSDDAFKVRRDNGTTYTVWATYQGAGFEPNSINEDPSMVNPGGANFALEPGSPCIDAGDYVGIPYYGDDPDIGALEYDTPPIPGNLVLVLN